MKIQFNEGINSVYFEDCRMLIQAEHQSECEIIEKWYKQIINHLNKLNIVKE